MQIEHEQWAVHDPAALYSIDLYVGSEVDSHTRHVSKFGPFSPILADSDSSPHMQAVPALKHVMMRNIILLYQTQMTMPLVVSFSNMKREEQ
jgi:hypothetical protein